LAIHTSKTSLVLSFEIISLAIALCNKLITQAFKAVHFAIIGKAEMMIFLLPRQGLVASSLLTIACIPE
jgi:hypothetical protein